MPLLPAFALNPTVAALSAGAALAYAVLAWAHQRLNAAQVRSVMAVAWLLHHPARVIPVLGTNSLFRIATISDALRVPMDRQTWFELYTLAIGREVA